MRSSGAALASPWTERLKPKRTSVEIFASFSSKPGLESYPNLPRATLTHFPHGIAIPGARSRRANHLPVPRAARARDGVFPSVLRISQPAIRLADQTPLLSIARIEAKYRFQLNDRMVHLIQPQLRFSQAEMRLGAVRIHLRGLLKRRKRILRFGGTVES